MVFNWFRRKFDDDKDAQNQQNQAVEPVVTEEQAPEPEVTEAPAASQDLLNWAKAAYANVQQQSEIAEVAESEGTDAVAIEAEPVASEVIATEVQVIELAVNDSVLMEVAETKISEPIVTTEITESLEQSQSVEAIAPEVDLIAEPKIEPISPNTDAPVPFWMQSESDRLARIAALEATAIAAPEPEVKPAPRRKATIKFDDDFIWSAEVLASQGRRPEEISVEEITWLNRLRQGLDKTRLSLVNQLKSIVGQGPLNPEAVDDIEALLLQADVGVKATDQIITKLQDKLRSEVLPPEEAIAYLKQILREMLDVTTQKGGEPIPMLIPEKNQLNIWLITGVNGAGKTTTIGKLSHLSVKSGYKTLIAAADTFRAAAVEQVRSWGLRSNVEVIANPAQNADPAAVVFDAIAAAQARGTELLLVDTAGRL